MILGYAQKKALELLQEYGSLREDQLGQLLAPQLEYLDMAAIKKQLIYYGLIQPEGAYMILSGRDINSAVIKAIDVMLSFPISEIQLHKAALEPFLLTFFKNNTDGKLCRYDICSCEPGSERIISARLEGLNEKYRTILIMLSDIKQRQALHIAQNHCFVVSTGNTHKFYKPTQLASPASSGSSPSPEIGEIT